jgi:anti-anti-sigma regulatory factor
VCRLDDGVGPEGAIMEPLMLAVENPAAGVVVVRVAGDLDRSTAPRLARLLDAQLDRCLEVGRGGTARTADGRPYLIVDLGGIRYFGPGGLLVLRHAQYTADQADIGLVLTGLTARAGLLPAWAAELVAGFPGLPTAEDAVAGLRSSPERHLFIDR